MIKNAKEKPQLIETAQGFSVAYNGRYLYSKYAPQKAILAILSSLELLPGTLILACSPCLLLGLQELCKKLPENCFVLGCEKDNSLFGFTKQRLAGCHRAATNQRDTECTRNDAYHHDAARTHGGTDLHNAADPSNAKLLINNFALLEPTELDALPFTLLKRHAVLACGTVLPKPGTFRRVIRIDFSAGTQFFPQYYDALAKAAEESVARFWKNRVTLVKLGRKFSRNLFRNLAHVPASVPLQSLAHAVAKPIIVFGAGESMEATAQKLLEMHTTHNGCKTSVREQFYVIASDAAFPSLCALGIVPDAIVCEEAQTAIAHAFFGTAQKKVRTFAGITSWPKTFDASGSNICYFATQYDDTFFFENLVQRKLLPPVMPPLGSVGLTAMNIALFLRCDERTPIFASGLDFSYSLGATHARGAPAHTARLANTTRTAAIANYDAAFSYGAQRTQGKDDACVFTTPTLLSYAHTFRSFFACTRNVYDAGKSGLDLGIERRTIDEHMQSEMLDASPLCATTSKTMQTDNVATSKMTKTSNATTFTQNDNTLATRIAQFYDEEKYALTELKKLLQYGQHMEKNKRNKKIAKLLECREYLYLHFPDGWKFSLAPSFLTRVRAEINFFIKDIRIAQTLLKQ
ncbi:MAG: DUF115 domain-containing protein [Treponema sp.]|nr:DUF115 domain-containing protein [Treponema sp.]